MFLATEVPFEAISSAVMVFMAGAWGIWKFWSEHRELKKEHKKVVDKAVDYDARLKEKDTRIEELTSQLIGAKDEKTDLAREMSDLIVQKVEAVNGRFADASDGLREALDDLTLEIRKANGTDKIHHQGDPT